MPAKNMDEYLAALLEVAKNALEKLRKTIKATSPKACEVINYQIPTFKYHGPLVDFAAYKNHCSFFVMSPPLMEPFKRELDPYDTSGATIRFQADKPLPDALVKKLVKTRAKENEAKSKK